MIIFAEKQALFVKICNIYPGQIMAGKKILKIKAAAERRRYAIIITEWEYTFF